MLCVSYDSLFISARWPAHSLIIPSYVFTDIRLSVSVSQNHFHEYTALKQAEKNSTGHINVRGNHRLKTHSYNLVLRWRRKPCGQATPNADVAHQKSHKQALNPLAEVAVIWKTSPTTVICRKRIRIDREIEITSLWNAETC